MFGIALATAFIPLNGNWLRFDITVLWTWASLMLWCVPAWDFLWSSTIGHDLIHSRLWGLCHLGLRMALLAPAIIGLALITGHPINALYALLTLLLAVPYWVYGYLLPANNGRNVIPASEYTAGAMIGALILLACQ